MYVKVNSRWLESLCFILSMIIISLTNYFYDHYRHFSERLGKAKVSQFEIALLAADTFLDRADLTTARVPVAVEAAAVVVQCEALVAFLTCSILIAWFTAINIFITPHAHLLVIVVKVRCDATLEANVGTWDSLRPVFIVHNSYTICECLCNIGCNFGTLSATFELVSTARAVTVSCQPVVQTLAIVRVLVILVPAFGLITRALSSDRLLSDVFSWVAQKAGAFIRALIATLGASFAGAWDLIYEVAWFAFITDSIEITVLA